MEQSYFHRVHQNTPTRLWINNISTGQVPVTMEHGARNCTQNPTYAWKMLNDPVDGPAARELLDRLIREEPDDETVQCKLQMELIRRICERYAPVFAESHGRAGWVTIQGTPLVEDVDTIVRWGRIYRQAAPNMMLKIPATQDGLAAIGILLEEGCPILATEVMAVAQFVALAEVYEAARAKMANPPVMYFAHIPGIFDEEMQAQVKEQGIDIDPDALYQAGVLVAKKIHRMRFDRKYSVQMLSGGARDLHHFTELVGADCAVTINWKGTADKLAALDRPAVDRFSAAPSPDAVDELLEKLPDFRRAWERGGLAPAEFEGFPPVIRFRRNFEVAWNRCLEAIAARRAELA